MVKNGLIVFSYYKKKQYKIFLLQYLYLEVFAGRKSDNNNQVTAKDL